MKKLFLLIAVVAMVLPSCKKINEAIDDLDNRLNKLEQTAIPSINEQIAAINLSLDALEDTDKELKGYIDGLQATADNLQNQINTTNAKIEEVETALQGEISTAKADVLAQLEAVKTELEGELATINATIETLKAKDAELDQKIADLRSYVDTELGKTTDWVNATFATLTQYNALVSEVTTIKGQIVAINESIADLETRLTAKINEDIATAVSTLNSTIQQKVKEITDGYTEAVKNAKEEITAAYTKAIQDAISGLELSLKSWVGQQLSNYYTIAEVEAKVLALQNAIASGDSSLQEELNNLKSQLEASKKELTEAYKKAIEEAINTNDGVIDTKIANEVAAANNRINSEIATINAKISAIEARLDNVEAQIKDLLARIQSVSYIPTYSDGKATVEYAGNAVSRVTLDFEISPKDAVAELANVWNEALSIKAVSTQTRAVSFTEMPIVSFEADTVNGIISVTASGENLSEAFFAGTQEASARLSISDGNNFVTSEYIPMVAKTIFVGDILTIPDNEIWYANGSTTEATTPNNSTVFGANILSNTYDTEKACWVIKFDGDISTIGNNAFRHCYSLTRVSIPNSVTSVGNEAFFSCTSLTSVIIPNSVLSIQAHAFNSCRSLTNITIGNSVTSIEEGAFSNCISLTSITIPNSVSSIEYGAFQFCTSLTSVTIPNSVTKIGDHVFNGCTSMASVIISNGITSIGEATFNNCTSLTTITIPDSVTSIGDWAFDRCSSLKSVYCKPITPPIGVDNMFDNNASGRKIYVPVGSGTAYKTAPYWSEYAADIVEKEF